MRSTNRGVTLAGANNIFEVAGIIIEEIPTGGYRIASNHEMASKTLTELCRSIVLELSSRGK